jgi:hypothetical protein
MELNILGNWLLVIAMIPAVLSVLVYSRVKWYRSQAGIHLMTYMAAIASVLLLGVLRIVIADSEVFYLIRVLAYIAVVIVLWWRLSFLIKSYREKD